MFVTLDRVGLERRPLLRTTMFRDRARQFVERHRWPLDLDDRGLEVDHFDDIFTTYCVVAEGAHHLASARLRPARFGSMVERHLPQFRVAAAHRLREGTEVSRFCVSPRLAGDERPGVVSDLLLGLCRHCQNAGIPSFFGVVFPAVARVLRQAGWPGAILAEARLDDATGLLLEWRASELVAWEIEAARSRREERLREGRAKRAARAVPPGRPGGLAVTDRAA